MITSLGHHGGFFGGLGGFVVSAVQAVVQTVSGARAWDPHEVIQTMADAIVGRIIREDDEDLMGGVL